LLCIQLPPGYSLDVKEVLVIRRHYAGKRLLSKDQLPPGYSLDVKEVLVADVLSSDVAHHGATAEGE